MYNMRCWKGREGKKRIPSGMMTASGNKTAGGTKSNSKIQSLPSRRIVITYKEMKGEKFGKVIGSV